ncbi:putative serine/threonine-protein kinase PIX13 isoform X1 [Cinnamomum micranthum f. kanehirae]|uniref:Putative serine/threonine-protein kinase PIX13 isoform X1 n=1 Tax=Cinnamomum micranthum f. kanehirae TaxID=337451 RepID=A0A3S3MER6_9MAGN|nr:putative serine/threonine-protein kinase PIX13 isoform X1 [Cinnamomum micranthum f. kanehirae]
MVENSWISNYGKCASININHKPGHLYAKSDVFSFGVVWLEMLSGVPVLDLSRPTERCNLVKWAKPYLSNRTELLSHVMDKQIEGQYPSEGAVLAANLTLKCLETEQKSRPSMSEVVRTLEEIQAIKHEP